MYKINKKIDKKIDMELEGLTRFHKVGIHELKWGFFDFDKVKGSYVIKSWIYEAYPFKIETIPKNAKFKTAKVLKVGWNYIFQFNIMGYIFDGILYVPESTIALLSMKQTNKNLIWYNEEYHIKRKKRNKELLNIIK